MKSAVTISLVPEARGGPFVFAGDLAAACREAASLGFDAVEIFPRSAEEFRALLVGDCLQQHGLALAAVGTGAGWVAHQLRLTDRDATVRRRAREFVAAIIDEAGALGAPAIVGSMQGRWEGDVTRAQALAWLREALEELSTRAQSAGVPLLFEFLNRYESNLLNTVAESLEFLRPLRAPNVKLLCDLFHMNIEEASIPDALRAAGARLGHVHLADSNRLAAGLGHTDFAAAVRALREIGYSGYLSAEVFPRPDSATAARKTIESFRRIVKGG